MPDFLSTKIENKYIQKMTEKSGESIYNCIQRGGALVGQVIYADLLFLIDFSMDFLCFYITSKILHRQFKVIRCIIASILGGIYSVIVLFFSFQTLVSIIIDLCACTIICFISFKNAHKSLYEFTVCTSVFFGVSAGLGGFMTAMFSLLNRIDIPLEEIKENGDGISVWLFGILAIISGLITAFGGKLFKKASITNIVDIDIEYKEKRLMLKAFVDTGNFVRDPISGKNIIIIEKNILKNLIGEAKVKNAIDGKIESFSITDKARIRIIPIVSATGQKILCAFRPDAVKITIINNKKKRIIAP